jgi:type VI secretion system secreted protein VgrG
MKQFAELDSPLGDDLRFSHLMATEAISEPYTLSITALSRRADIDYRKLLGERVSVRVNVDTLAGAEPRLFDGLVEQVALVGRQDGWYAYHLQARPWFWFLTQTQDCKVFQNKTVLEIIDAVLADHGFAVLKKRTTQSYTAWPYCVQYRESDFNFLSRLMEQEGISYFFEHTAEGHAMVLVDGADGCSTAAGCDALPLRVTEAGAASQKPGIFDFSTRQRVQPGKAVLADYDFTRSRVDIAQSASQPGEHTMGEFEVFDYPGFFDREDDGKHFVQAQMEEYACAALQSSGTTNVRTLACGTRFGLTGSLRPAENTDYLVTGTRIECSQTAFEAGGSSGAGWQCRLTAAEAKIPFRTPRRTPKPVVQGPQTAVVVGPSGEEIHTDKYGRVKVQFHWDRYGPKNEKSSCWVRVSSPWAGKSFGFVQIPRIGQEVIVDFLEGDPDQPIVTGRVYNAEHMPPWELPANATQSGVLTRSSKGGAYGNANAIRFEDKKGSEQLWIHAEKNQDIEVENDETHWVGHDRRKTVDHDETTHVKHDRTETVDNNETITIGANRTETVGRNETISIGSNRSISVGANETATVAAQRTHTVGANETIAIGAAQEVAIGAAQAVTVGANQSVSVGADQSVSVGSNRSVEVGKNLNLTVGEARKTSIGKDDALKVGKKLVIEAGDEITIKTGDASITMKKDGTVTIKGKDITLSGSGKINVKASSDVVIKGSKIAQN